MTTAGHETKCAATVHSEMKSIVVFAYVFYINLLRLILLYTNLYYRAAYDVSDAQPHFPVERATYGHNPQAYTTFLVPPTLYLQNM